MTLKTESEAIRRITVIGMVVNILLALIKLIVGYRIESIGLIADGFHSFSDLITDILVIAGSWFALKPPDENHPFGHGKFETMTSWAVAAVLILAGVWIAWEGIHAFSEHDVHEQSSLIIIVALISVVSKEVLFHLTMRVAKSCRSLSLKGNAWHHRSDAFSSVVVLVGGVAAFFGYAGGDSIAGIAVGAMVIAVGFKLGIESMKELSESSAGGEIERNLEETIESFDEVKGWHRLRARKIGRQLELDVHIILDGAISIKDGHDIVLRIEDAIARNSEWPVHLTIHIDPDTEDIRNSDQGSGRKFNR